MKFSLSLSKTKVSITPSRAPPPDRAFCKIRIRPRVHACMHPAHAQAMDAAPLYQVGV
jgi:hypothetical protein